MELKNLMEIMVMHSIDEVKKYYDFCNCPHCRLDIAALALNKLPPRYVVTSKGESYGSAELLHMQKDLDLLSTVLAAIKIVQRKPRHYTES